MRSFLLVLLVLVALGAAGCGGGDDSSSPSAPETTTVATDEEPGDDGGTTADEDAADGAAVFADAGCGSCHVLAAADASGSIGPNLDEVSLEVGEVEEQVRNGGGAMPAFEDELSDAEITAVSEYVVESSASG